MKRPVALASLALAMFAVPARAERVISEIRWSALKVEGRLAGGEVVPPGGGVAFESLRVTNPDASPRVVPLVVIDRPGIEGPRYALRGDVRGEEIEGRAYLEMWSFFPGGGRYFSRTLADGGPMASLAGTFSFRSFVLPFTAEPGMKPERLAVNVAFPGRGTVTLGPVRLVELGPGDDPFLPTGAWLTFRQIGLYGGIGGGLLGVAGALVGFLSSRGQARALVLALLRGMLAVGIASLAALALAWWSGQPGAVLFLLFLVGAICSAVPAGMLGKIRRQYEELELRRMRALDAR
ncbi:MAG TPA: hypothetical protein VLH41_04720 [Thermoanaerobaculia bacterium]|nr:hypothetical protein [Thermoanaerobaculia bacterium]